MQRGEIGRYEAAVAGGEPVRAFVPAPLPPDPALAPDGPRQQTLETATLALGRRAAVSALLPDEALVPYSCVRKEAVLSSRIEGTQSSLSDLLLFELEEAPGIPLDDAREVSNHAAALEHGLRRLTEGSRCPTGGSGRFTACRCRAGAAAARNGDASEEPGDGAEQ